MPQPKSVEPPCTDPYARWCGRGGAARLPPIPIIFAIFLGATCFSVVLRGVGGDEAIAALLTAIPLETGGVIFLMLGMVFVLGFVLDWIEITLIVLPLLQPVLAVLGADPLWFTILVAVCLQTSFLTPPVVFACSI